MYMQMENIQLFLNFCESYGVPKTGLFQTVDLFEGRNLPQVLNCIQQLGSEVSLSYFRTTAIPVMVQIPVIVCTKRYFTKNLLLIFPISDISFKDDN